MISDLILGAMYFGTKTDRATSYALLDRFVEAGGTTIDTANCYSFWTSETGAGGQSEALIGDWLRSNPGMRERLIIATKVGPGAGRVPAPVEGLSADVIAEACAVSLERLGIETIDLYWAHSEDRSVDLAETVAAFGALVAQRLGEPSRDLQPSGLAGRASPGVRPGQRDRAVHSAAADHVVRPAATRRARARQGPPVRVRERRDIDYLTEHPEFELWAYSPLVQGSYDRADRPFPEAYDHPGTTRRLAALSEVAGALGATHGQVVLAWLMASTPSIRPIVGVSSIEQFDEALGADRIDLTADHLAVLDAAQ